MSEFDDPALVGLGLALASGLLIGLERGWQQRERPEGHRVAGVRTFALIGLLASLVPLISRVQAEESNKYYDIVLDYNSMRSMARQSSQSEDEWIDLFKSLGVDKVALSEASALNLHDNAAIPVHAMTVKKAAESYGWEEIGRAHV